MRKFVKTTITVTVLHEPDYAIHKYPLQAIINDMDDGETVGQWEIVESNDVPLTDAEKELVAVGNDGTFFGDEE